MESPCDVPDSVFGLYRHYFFVFFKSKKVRPREPQNGLFKQHHPQLENTSLFRYIGRKEPMNTPTKKKIPHYHRLDVLVPGLSIRQKV